MEARAAPAPRLSPDARIVLLFTHPDCLLHAPGPGHPEAPARLAAVLEALQASGLALEQREAPLATREQLLRVHAAALVDDILGRDVDQVHRIDADTVMSPHSAAAALRAAGAACAAVDALLQGDALRAFCAVRPPGHHATRAKAMGFCLFNSVAVAAAHGIARHGLQRVAIVDFDVHHGNGTQDIFWDDARVLYVSSHQDPLYPGTGAGHERGAGNIVNAPLPEGSDSRAFREEWRNVLLPALDAFRPQLLLVSAGFDGHRLDPLAGLELSADDYGWLTRALVDCAETHAGGRIASALEGGYSLTALRESSVAHVAALMDRAVPVRTPPPFTPPGGNPAPRS